MPNISGYKDLGGGLATLVFDDGQESQPVVLDDKLKGEVTMVASLVNPTKGALSNAGASLANANGSAAGSAPQALPPVPSMQLDQPTFQPPPPTSAVPTSTVPSLSDAAPSVPAAPTPGATNLPLAQRTTENPLGTDAPVVRNKLEEAATADQQANEAGAQAKADAALVKGKLIGDRLAQMDVERQANEAEAARHDAAVTEASNRWAQVSQSQPKPEQAFANEPTWYKVLALIGAGAGAAAKGSTIMHGGDSTNIGNSTVGEIDKAIAQSMASQIATRGSEIQRLSSVLGTEQAAQAAVKARMQKAVEDRLTLGVMQAETEGEANFYRATLGKFKADRLRTEAQGIASTASSIKDVNMAPKPVKGGAAGPTDYDASEYAGIMKRHGVNSKEMNTYGEARTKSGADETLSLVGGAEETINKLSSGQDVPGVGPIDKFWDAWTRDPDGAAVQQVLGMTKSAFIKSVSGASTTDSERATLSKLVEGRGTLEDVQRGLALMKRQARQQLRTIDSSHPAEADAYEEIDRYRQTRAKNAQPKTPEGPPTAPAPAAAPSAPSGDKKVGDMALDAVRAISKGIENQKPPADTSAFNNAHKNQVGGF